MVVICYRYQCGKSRIDFQDFVFFSTAVRLVTSLSCSLRIQVSARETDTSQIPQPRPRSEAGPGSRTCAAWPGNPYTVPGGRVLKISPPRLCILARDTTQRGALVLPSMLTVFSSSSFIVLSAAAEAAGSTYSIVHSPVFIFVSYRGIRFAGSDIRINPKLF